MLFVNSVAVPGTFDSAPEFVRNRAVTVPDNDDGFVNNNDPAEPSGENNGGNDMEFKNVDELRNGCPDLVKEIVDSERAAAQKAERERLAAIDEIAETIPANMVAEAKYGENACSAEQLAYRAAVAQRRITASCWKIPQMMQTPAAQTALAVQPPTAWLVLALRTRTRPMREAGNGEEPAAPQEGGLSYG